MAPMPSSPPAHAPAAAPGGRAFRASLILRVSCFERPRHRRWMETALRVSSCRRSSMDLGTLHGMHRKIACQGADDRWGGGGGSGGGVGGGGAEVGGTQQRTADASGTGGSSHCTRDDASHALWGGLRTLGGLGETAAGAASTGGGTCIDAGAAVGANVGAGTGGEREVGRGAPLAPARAVATAGALVVGGGRGALSLVRLAEPNRDDAFRGAAFARAAGGEWRSRMMLAVCKLNWSSTCRVELPRWTACSWRAAMARRASSPLPMPPIVPVEEFGGVCGGGGPGGAWPDGTGGGARRAGGGMPGGAMPAVTGGGARGARGPVDDGNVGEEEAASHSAGRIEPSGAKRKMGVLPLLDEAAAVAGARCGDGRGAA